MEKKSKVVMVSLDKWAEMYSDKIAAEWEPMSGGSGSGIGAGGAGGTGSGGQEKGAGGGGAAKGGGGKRLSDEEHFQKMMDAPEPNLQDQLAGFGYVDRQLVDPSPEQKREEDNFWRGEGRGVLAKNMMRAGKAMTNTYKIGSGVKKGDTSAKEVVWPDTEGMTSAKNILNEMKELEERKASAKKSRTSAKAAEGGGTSAKKVESKEGRATSAKEPSATAPDKKPMTGAEARRVGYHYEGGRRFPVFEAHHPRKRDAEGNLEPLTTSLVYFPPP